MCWVLRVLRLCPVNVESDAHLTALRGEIFLLVKSVGPGVGQDLVVSRNVGSRPDTNNPRSHVTLAIPCNTQQQPQSHYWTMVSHLRERSPWAR